MNKSFLILLIVVGMFFFLPLLGVLLGAFAGFVVGLFFDQTILSFLSQFGVEGLEMWEIGASLGFISAFFRNIDTKKES